MIFYTADLHLGHKNIIRLCNRPFSSVEEMDAALIANWNAVVGAEDTVYILGDFSFRSPTSMKPVHKILNGIKHLVVGNHDKSWLKNIKPEEYFASVSPLLEIDDGDTHITLCHYPMLSWNRLAHDSIHIHGHIHNNTNGIAYPVLKDMPAYNAGVEVNNYFPVTLEKLKANKVKFYEEHPVESDTGSLCGMAESEDDA